MASAGLVVAQLIFIVGIFCMAFIAGILPGIIPWCKNSTGVLGIANAFSGGVFLAIAFMHILPEVSESYADVMSDDKEPENYHHGDDEEGGDPFPLPFALVFVGYAFILLIDKVIFDTHSLVGQHDHGHLHDPVMDNVRSSFIQLQKNNSDNHQACPNGQSINDSQMNEVIKNYLTRNDKFSVRMSHALKRNPTKVNHSRTFVKAGSGLDDEQEALFADKNNINLKATVGENNEALLPNEVPPKKWCNCNLTPVVLMIALSTHATFEGIAVGLVHDLSDLWTFVIAIGLHKWAAAMSLGISMNKNFKDEKSTIYILLLIFA